MRTVYDVVIIGGGLSGSFAAYKMSQNGLKVLVIESKNEIRRKVCGEYLCPLGVQLLEKEGLKEDIVDSFLPIYGMKITPCNNNTVITDFPETHRTNYGISVDREKFDNKFINLAKSAGTTFITGVRASKFIRDLSYWTIQASNEESYHGRLLVGADGMSSVVAKNLGLREKADTSRVALHCHIKSISENSRYGEMHLFEDGNYIGIDPTGDYELNVSLVCNKEQLASDESISSVLNRYISRSQSLSKLIGTVNDDVHINVVTPLTNKTLRSTDEDVALIGDAAGFIDPLTGEGMYFALWTALTLSDLVLRDKNSTLFSYSRAIKDYEKHRSSFLRQKAILNRAFQFIIKVPWITKLLANYFNKKKKRADTFIGIIGNIYKPVDGILRILFS